MALRATMLDGRLGGSSKKKRKKRLPLREVWDDVIVNVVNRVRNELMELEDEQRWMIQKMQTMQRSTLERMCLKSHPRSVLPTTTP